MFENDPNNIHDENATNNIFNLPVTFKLTLQTVLSLKNGKANVMLFVSWTELTYEPKYLETQLTHVRKKLGTQLTYKTDRGTLSPGPDFDIGYSIHYIDSKCKRQLWVPFLVRLPDVPGYWG